MTTDDPEVIWTNLVVIVHLKENLDDFEHEHDMRLTGEGHLSGVDGTKFYKFS